MAYRSILHTHTHTHIHIHTLTHTHTHTHSHTHTHTYTHTHTHRHRLTHTHTHTHTHSHTALNHPRPSFTSRLCLAMSDSRISEGPVPQTRPSTRGLGRRWRHTRVR